MCRFNVLQYYMSNELKCIFRIATLLWDDAMFCEPHINIKGGFLWNCCLSLHFYPTCNSRNFVEDFGTWKWLPWHKAFNYDIRYVWLSRPEIYSLQTISYWHKISQVYMPICIVIEMISYTTSALGFVASWSLYVSHPFSSFFEGQ